MISNQKFDGFNPKFIVVGCFLEHDGKILMLRRHKDKPEGGTWATPSGKVDAGETEGDALVREVFEETGIAIDQQRLIFIERSYVRFSFDFMYIFFRYGLDSMDKPKVILNPIEHSEYKWMMPQQALDLGVELMPDEDYCIRRTYDI